MGEASKTVFICYAREDETVVLSLGNQLRARGTDVWIDQWAIPKGVDWDRAIDEALASCACLLVVLTPSSVSSEEVRGELRTALDTDKPIVPLLLLPCNVPRRLRLLQHIDISQGQPDSAANVERVVRALDDVLSAPDRREERQEPLPVFKPVQQRKETRQTFFWNLRERGKSQLNYIVALGFPPLAIAMWHMFRLPILLENLPYLLFAATAILGGVVLYLGSRTGAILITAGIGVSLALKPLLVPFEDSGGVFSYDSETAMYYWLPGVIFMAAAAAVALASTGGRLMEDLLRLRPRIGTLIVAVVAAGAANSYFAGPTRYDVYREFRPQYQALREHFKQVAGRLDGAAEPSCVSSSLEPPLVLDQSSNVRNEDAATTGHILLHHHLTDPDGFPGEIEYAFNDDLLLHMRDTGSAPVLYAAGFGSFASEQERTSLQHVLNAPYLVVIRPLAAGSQINYSNIEAGGPYRVYLYHLGRDETLCTADAVSGIATVDELKEAVFSLLQNMMGARIIR